MLRFRAAIAVAALACAPACSSNLFADYPELAAPGMRAFQQGRFDAAAEQFDVIRRHDDDDAFLAWAEAGMAHHVGGDPAAAIDAWLRADQVLDDFGDRPTISGRSLTEGFVSALVNEKALPYDGEDFEVALLHAFLAWDFLRRGDLDGALVEVRQGYLAEQQAEDRYEKQYAGMNAFARFVAALAQEADGRFDEAEIDLRRLAEQVPGHPAVDYGLERVEAYFGGGWPEEAARAQLVVVHEAGRMPHKIPQEVGYHARRSIGRVSFPAFGPARHAPSGLQVAVDGDAVGETRVLEDVLSVARENLDDRIGWLVAKGLGRAAAKTILIDQAARQVERKHGEGWAAAVSIFGSLLQIASERADLRSWTTLPQAIAVLRVPVEPGERLVAVQLPGHGRVELGKHSFQPGRPVLVTVRSLGSQLWAQVGPLPVGLDEPAPEAEAAAPSSAP